MKKIIKEWEFQQKSYKEIVRITDIRTYLKRKGSGSIYNEQTKNYVPYTEKIRNKLRDIVKEKALQKSIEQTEAWDTHPVGTYMDKYDITAFINKNGELEAKACMLSNKNDKIYGNSSLGSVSIIIDTEWV